MSFAARLFLLLITLSLPAMAQTAPPVQTEQQFVATMAERFETQDKTPEPPVPEPVTPAPVEAKKPSETDPDVATPDEEPAPPSSTPKAPDESTPDPDQPLSPEPEPTADDEDEEIDEEFAAAATAAKVKLTVDDLPEEARPLVKKRIKELEAGFTKAMQDARSYRADEAKFRAEQKFQKENPAEFVADLLLQHPELGDQVNAIIDGITTPATREAHSIVVEKRRADALTATQQQLKQQEVRVARGMELDSYSRTAALKAGVPFELGVETAVIAHITANGDITERDIDTIVSAKKAEYERHVRAVRREASKKYVDKKLESRKDTPVVKPGSGNAPAPAAKARPKNDAEFTEQFAGKI